MDPDVPKIIIYILIYLGIDLLFNLCEYEIKKYKRNKENAK